MVYIVWYCGEYDEDENGNLFTVSREFQTYEEAKRAADEWEMATGNPSRIETTFGNDYYEDIESANKAYNAEDYDEYESILEKCANKYGMPMWQFEDACTDVRLFGSVAC